MERLGDYELVRELARGGQGVVYEARLGARPLALKLLLDADPLARARFRREAEVLARLRHPHLPQVIAFEEHAGRPFLVLELIEGPDAAELLGQSGRLTALEAVELLAPVAEALAYAHGAGVVHRDVKPNNIRLASVDERPVLVDFGIAKVERGERLTATGEVIGTPQALAPEQLDPTCGEVGPATDVYGLGVTLFWLLTGQPPFSGATLVNLWHEILKRPAPDPRTLAPDVPPALAELTCAMLAKAPAERPDSAALPALLRASLTGAASAGGIPRGLLASLAGLAALALAALIAALAGPEPPDPVETPDPPAQVASGATVPAPQTPAADPTYTQDNRRGKAMRLWSRGHRRLSAGRYQEAIEAYTQSLAIDPTLRINYLKRGEAYRRMGRFREAIADFDEALASSRNRPIFSAKLHFQRGMAEWRRGRPQGAIADFERSIELDPKPPRAHYFLGAVLAEGKRFREAAAALDRCVVANEAAGPGERLGNVYELRGDARFGLGDHAGAARDYRRQLKLTPDLPRAAQLRAFIRQTLGP